MCRNDFGISNYLKTNNINGNCLARVIGRNGNSFELYTETGRCNGYLSGKLKMVRDSYPVIGDFVLYSSENKSDIKKIVSLLPRKSLLYRKDMWGETGVQCIASNIDRIFICCSLNNDFNINKIKRMIILAKKSGSEYTVLLTKSDLIDDAFRIQERLKIELGVSEVSYISIYNFDEMKRFESMLISNKTYLFLGSSGVGKSSIINYLMKSDIVSTSSIGRNDKGKHTTVSRTMYQLPSGVILVDIPGVREFGLHDMDDVIQEMFVNINELSSQCKFKNCTHKIEPGCAIRNGIVEGKLTEKEYLNYLQYMFESQINNDRPSYLYRKWEQSKKESKNRRIRRNNKYKK